MMESNNNVVDPCIVCFRTISVFSVGACEHSVCFECSARMRVLMKQNECPICRTTLDYVIFTPKIRPFSQLQQKLHLHIFLPVFGIYVEDESTKSKLDRLLESRCGICQTSFDNFEQLRMHVQKKHERFYCGLCTENIKHFPSERVTYTRPLLATHNRIGDPQDSSHRGHPQCEFCSVRFFDSDILFRHLRKDHYFCHFCDADGFNFYYDGYEGLRLHYRREHYLCEEEGCKDEKFTSVFRQEVDWRAHLSTVHSRLLGKAGTKAARSLDVAFRRPNPSAKTESVPVFIQPEINTESSQEFPSLAGQNPTPLPSRVWTAKTKLDEDFPALNPSAGNPASPASSKPGSSFSRPVPSRATGAPPATLDFTRNAFPGLPTSTSASRGSVLRQPSLGSGSALRQPTLGTSTNSGPVNSNPIRAQKPPPPSAFPPLVPPQPSFLRAATSNPRSTKEKKPDLNFVPLPTREELRERLEKDGAVLLQRDEPEEGKKKVKKKNKEKTHQHS